LKKELGNTSFVVSSSGGGADQNCMWEYREFWFLIILFLIKNLYINWWY
jgi:hypothetical protein